MRTLFALMLLLCAGCAVDGVYASPPDPWGGAGYYGPYATDYDGWGGGFSAGPFWGGGRGGRPGGHHGFHGAGGGHRVPGVPTRMGHEGGGRH